MTHRLREGLPKLPETLRDVPVDARGYPVPFFVAWVDGQPDHRVIDPKKLVRCVREQLCWICGQPLRWPAVIVNGPMGCVNRVSSEPPSHEACARFSVTACPFLSRPHAHRREAGMPDGHCEAPGVMLKHNPGISLLWWTSRVEAFSVARARYLFSIGTPLRVEWWTQGRRATREEADQAIVAGLPHLVAMASDEEERATLQHQADELRAWLPPEV